MSIFIGLDMSLSSTGFCLKDSLHMTMDTIRTKPDSFTNDLDRLKHIAAETMKRIPKDVTMICMEDFFTPFSGGTVGAAISLAMLGTLVRMNIYEAGRPFYLISASQLKKYATGKGNSQKSIVICEVYKRWGVDCKDDNQADACVLAFMAEAIYDSVHGQDVSHLTQFQAEVISKVIADRPHYNC